MKRRPSKVITAADLKRLAKPQKVSEAHIQQICIEWMELDGWRSLATDPKWARGLGVAEPGIPDNLFIRYGDGERLDPVSILSSRVTRLATILWVEFKRIDGSASKNQLKWHALERSRGGLVWVAGVEFPKTIEGFQEHYRNSGLMRRKL